jgi:hypothetical protein
MRLLAMGICVNLGTPSVNFYRTTVRHIIHENTIHHHFMGTKSLSYTTDCMQTTLSKAKRKQTQGIYIYELQ